MTWFSNKTLLHTVVSKYTYFTDLIQKLFIYIKINKWGCIGEVSKPSLCNKFQHCFTLNAAFFKCRISAQVSIAFFLTTFSCPQTLVLQTVATIHHIPLCRNGHSNILLTDHLCISFRYTLYWTFILAGITGTVKTAHAPFVQTWKRMSTWKVLTYTQYFV